jgi:hypothetical protein
MLLSDLISGGLCLFSLIPCCSSGVYFTLLMQLLYASQGDVAHLLTDTTHDTWRRSNGVHLGLHCFCPPFLRIKISSLQILLLLVIQAD